MKPGVDQTSTNYSQALQDILNNPSHIYLYPQYYFICSPQTTSPTNPTTPTDPLAVANARLKKLADLYNCTTKIEGELGICTKTYSNVIPGDGTIYSAGRDDRSFANTYTNQSTSTYAPTQPSDLMSIQQVSYGEIVLFDYNQIADESATRSDPYNSPAPGNYFTFNGHHNDDNATGATVKINSVIPGAVSKDLVIKYFIDASCTQVNTNLGTCDKYYVQGQQKSGDTAALNRRGRVTDHFPASNIFKLPYYANTSKSITVKVDGVTQKQDIDWQLDNGSPAAIEFLPTDSGGLKVFDGQKVKITYFVDLTVNHIMDSKLAAQNEIKTTCTCADLNCTLAPVTDTAGKITDYSCVYPDPAPPTPPASQTIYLSSKTVPVRFFDNTGSSKSVINTDVTQELLLGANVFTYRNNNLLDPSNMPALVNPIAGSDNYVGFNEIYGSLNTASNSAKPAKEVAVSKGKIYDIYVDNGSYSNCTQCGNDYYSQLNRLFPLTQFGGGTTPLQSRTDRALASGIPADDMAFGRACFVPATMIPWTHATNSDPQKQRLYRMASQHFLYANGYQHDWYGFDYGAVIGSFDGIKWFAIGTNRRIKADSNKLFIAVNGPFGDLTLESTYTVTVNDGALNPVGANMVTKDYDSDGADCQRFHQCTSDNDCATTLGWDYACANVNEITTSWPKFDDNAKEIPDTQSDVNHLTSILGMSSTGKRCVYRGRGSACTQNYLSNVINLNSTFNQTQTQSFHTCSANNYCQSITTNSTLNPNFNNRIARYGKVRLDPTSDSFGLATKVPGRPMEFNAQETVRSETAKNFNSNRIAAICIPGRDPTAPSFISQNSLPPSSEYKGDRILNIGMSYSKTTALPNKNYLSACSVVNSTTKNYYYTTDSTDSLGVTHNPSSTLSAYTDLILDSGAQAVSTNALNIFTSIFNTKGSTFTLFRNNTQPITALTYTENRCMRAPAASCFTDNDCAPSKALSDKIKILSTSDTSIVGSTTAPVLPTILNFFELKFWQEELVCSQATAKNDPNYSAFNNRCCRDVGKTISLPSYDVTNNLAISQIPGIDIAIGSSNRYSRAAVLYKDTKTDPTNFPSLKVAIKDQCSSGSGCANISTLTNQYKSFSAFGERMSCSGDWVRSFANGGHTWSSTRGQTFNPTMFRCFNWRPATTTPAPPATGWTCGGLEKDSPDCQVVQTSPYSAKAKGVFNFLGKLELMGIPQIAIESEDYYNTSTAGDLSCLSNPLSQTDQTYPGGSIGSSNYTYPTQIYSGTSAKEYIDTSIVPNKQLYSAIDNTNFQNMKQIFSPYEVASCLAAGTTMAAGADPSLCCTGFINSKTNKCQLPDFVDLSVYTNRYVSSEAKKLSITLFDQNGYVKDPSYVASLACEKSMCASGTIAYGVLVSPLKNPGQELISDEAYRFIEGNTYADDTNGHGLLTLFTKGLKINTHAYCLPSGTTANGSSSFSVISCGN